MSMPNLRTPRNGFVQTSCLKALVPFRGPLYEARRRFLSGFAKVQTWEDLLPMVDVKPEGPGASMISLKAIETVYGNHRYRSREEARWAVFLDVLRIPFEYEKEGYDLDGLWYLPDFWLPQQQVWFEVKGQFPDETEWEKAGRLAVAAEREVWVACGPGSVGQLETPGFYFQFRDCVSPNGFLLCFGADGSRGIGNWEQCAGCGTFRPVVRHELNFVDRPDDLCCPASWVDPKPEALGIAYRLSRRARFQRGAFS